MDSQPWVPLILTASTRVPPPALPVPQPHLSELQGRVCPFWGPTPELAATLGFSFPQIPQPFLIVYPESECPPCPCLPGTNLDRGSGCPSASAQARDGVRPGGGLAGDSVLEGERGDLMRHHVGSSQKPENQSWRPCRVGILACPFQAQQRLHRPLCFTGRGSGGALRPSRDSSGFRL